MAADTMAPATAELYDRIVALFSRDVSPGDRVRIRDAFVPGATWETLPPDIQQLILAGEQLPAQAWDDPADMPGWDDDPEPPATSARQILSRNRG